uniref:Uncharacterized protein n=1 Tax=Anopheles farauti TaxID=69004 RepID=A0A182QAX4_9DIPT
MEPKKRFPGLIEPNKDSPFKILDVRSINQISTKFNNASKQEDAGEASDDSSGSEKELVIDMADAETEESQDTAEETNLLIETTEGNENLLPPESPPPPAPPVIKSPPKNRINRRKSRHVPMEDPDAALDAPVVPTIAVAPVQPTREPIVPEPSSGLQESLHANRNIMKHIALLRTTINYLVGKKHNRTIKFPVVTSDLSTMDSWMEKYEQIKRPPVGESSSKPKMMKKK